MVGVKYLVEIKSMSDFEENTSKYVSWLRENGVVISDKTTVADLRSQGQGRGLVAVKTISPDEDLFRIPRSITINIETSSLVCLDQSNKEKLLALNHWESLILILAYEMLIGEKSKWWPYFNVLPKEFNSLMFWNEKELESLKPSLVVTRVGKEEADEMYHRLFPKIAHSFNVPDLDNTSIEQYHEIANLIMSYSFDVERTSLVSDGEEDDDDSEIFGDGDDDEDGNNILKDGYFKSMVPLADTLNADTSLCNANLVYDSDFLIMKATQTISAGEQIYNTYADHPNSEILRRYGYVEWSGSKFDFGEIPLQTIKEFQQTSLKFTKEFVEVVLNVLTEESIPEIEEPIVLESYDCYSDGEIVSELILLLQIITIIYQVKSVENLESLPYKDQIKMINRISKKCFQLAASNKLSKSVKEVWSNLLKMRMEQYPTFCDNDFTKVSDNKQKFDRVLMSECVLKSEFKSLQNCSDPFKTFKFIDDSKLLKNILKLNASK